MKAALYLRVSTHEQNTASQRSALEQFAPAHGWSIVEVYEDPISGGKASRPALEKLLADARARRFDVVCVYKLDRFGRSLRDCLNHLRRLELHRVRFVGVTQGIDTDRADPAGRFLLHILAAAAEFEAELIRERVTAGMQAAKRPVFDVSIYKAPPHLLPDHSAAEVRKLYEEAWLTIESAAGLATCCRSECRFGLDRP